MIRPALVVAVLAALAAGCSKKAESAEPARAARPPFYYDLGPTTVDVSAYPAEQRAGYKLFLSVCATCHTPARPINAPIASAEDWTRYVQRMHVKMENKGIALSPDDERRILSFLAYDGRARKQGDAFKAEQERLKTAFENAGR